MSTIYNLLGIFFFWAIVILGSAWLLLFLLVKMGLLEKINAIKNNPFSSYLYCAWTWWFKRKKMYADYVRVASNMQLTPYSLRKYRPKRLFHRRYAIRLNTVVIGAITSVYAGKHPEWSDAEQHLTWAENRLGESSEK